MKKVEIIDNRIWCPKCQQYKSVDDFYLFNGSPKRPCKECKLKYQKLYAFEHQNEVKEYKANFYQEFREEIIADQLLRDSNRTEEIAQYQMIYRQLNKIELREKKHTYIKNKKLKDPSFKLRQNFSNTVFQALKSAGKSKNGQSILKHLSYTIQQLKEHIESLFESWMTWDNWGVFSPETWDDNDSSTWTWQIDHIIPQSVLPYISMEDDNFKKCWSLSNLRPLSAKQNVKDGSRKSRKLK